MSDSNYPTGYKVPRYNVLLLSCIDLRLLDNIVNFMDRENLTNRYDQFILAGTSIGAFVADGSDKELEKLEKYEGWKKALQQHVDLSIQLHDIHDIYIMEHRSCGAYKAFLKDGKGDFDHVHNGHALEFDYHKRYAERLTEMLLEYLEKRKKEVKKKKEEYAAKYDVPFNIHSFLMDLRGDVELLHTTAPE